MLFTSADRLCASIPSGAPLPRSLSDVHELSVRVIKAQSLGFNKVCLWLKALVRYGIQQQLRFPAANMTH